MPDNEYQNLGPKTLLIFIFGHTIFATMLLLIILALWRILNYYGDFELLNPYLDLINYFAPLLILLDLIFFFLMAFIAWWQYKNYKFQITDDSFRVMHGILTKEEVAIPYRRIESINLKQTLLYQIFGVSHLTIEIVSDDEAEVQSKANSDDEVLPAIDRHLALNIQQELTKRSNIQKMHMHQSYQTHDIPQNPPSPTNQ